jgi:hypothetical protein
MTTYLKRRRKRGRMTTYLKRRMNNLFLLLFR